MTNLVLIRSMLTWNSDYRLVLKHELSSRCRVNPQYSLRAFARTLDLTPSQLSAVMNSKYGLSPKKAQRITEKLCYSSRNSELFITLVEKEHARSLSQRTAAALKLEKFRTPDSYDTLEQETFEAVSRWYHFAIVELTRVNGFKSDPIWIAKRLGISNIDADLAVERLKRLGLLKVEDGKLIPSQDFYGSSPGIPSQARRNFHAQILEKAANALLMQPLEWRSISSSVIAVDSTQVPEVRKLAEEFRIRVDAILQKSETKNAVYALSVLFFELGQGAT